MDPTTTFDSYRPYLFAIAYRMLGSVMDAEDMVQETYLRWQQIEVDDVQSPKSFLAAIITRLCIDYLRSARVKRESYVGTWLPEPYLMDSEQTGETMAALSDSLSMAFLVLLESLAPTERAAFLLHDVFDYDYAEIAEIVDKSPANCRQMVSRARQRLHHGRPRFQATPAEQQQISAQFLQASLDGDMTGLLSLLAEDVVEYSDGGGKVPSAIHPLHGADKVSRFFVGLTKKAPPGTETHFGVANTHPALFVYLENQVVTVILFDIVDGRIQHIYAVTNPDKLRHIRPLGKKSN